MQAVANELSAILRTPAAKAISNGSRNPLCPHRRWAIDSRLDGDAIQILNSLQPTAVTEGLGTAR